MADLTKTNARFKLIETAQISETAPAFAVGQLIVDDKGNLSYDPSTGTSAANRINVVARGVANGLATLDVNGKVPTEQLPASVLGAVTYKGTWDASTGKSADGADIPAASEDNKGFYYITATAGTFQEISFEKGDWLISDGENWSKVDTADAVTSVNGKTGVVVIGIEDIDGLQAAIQAAKPVGDEVSTVVDGVKVSVMGAAAATEGQLMKKGATTVEWFTPDYVGEAPKDGKNYVRKDGAWAEQEKAETPTLQQVTAAGNTVTAGTATNTVTAGAIDIADTTGSKQFKVDVTNSTVTGDATLKAAFQEWMEMGAIYRAQ